MTMTVEYTAEVLPLFRNLVLSDPYCDAEDDDDGHARAAAAEDIVTANRYRVFVHAAQEKARVRVRVQVWDTEPADSPEGQWEDHRAARVECPEGQLMVENISAGAVDLQPGRIERIDLPGGPGSFGLRTWFRGRASTALQVTEAPPKTSTLDREQQLRALDGQEEYLIQIWRAGDLADDDQDDGGQDDEVDQQ